MKSNNLDKKIIDLITDYCKDELQEEIVVTSDLKLYGGSGILDSMSLVNLIVEIEEMIEDEFDISIIIADEKAMSRRTSPFSRVSNLIEYVKELCNE